jgi:ParB family transcriptional regulator, chromosome partitioning protein
MTELRSVDPCILQTNPNNPRKTPVPPAMEAQLLASIRAVGIIQPPYVTGDDGALTIVAGHRRVAMAIKAELTLIDVLVCDADEAADVMRSAAENLIRVSMSSVDTWRAIERLGAVGWNEQAISDALALPLRKVRCLKLLAHLHPPMLEVMAQGNMPNEDQLRTIAAATIEEQAQVWKKHKPRKSDPEMRWWDVARALEKRRIPFSAAQFGADLAKAYGVVWEEDLFAPAGEDGRYTTNAEGFFGAQQEHLQHSLPTGAVLLTVNEYGCANLPKKAERVHGKPGKGDVTGYYINPRTAAIETAVYRLPKPSKTDKGKGGEEDVTAKVRAPVTQKGLTMIGDLRTDALHQVLAEGPIEDDTLLGLLVLAFAGDNVNVNVDSGDGSSGTDRRAIAWGLLKGSVLDAEADAIHQAARKMLVAVLSCRDNRTQSGVLARVAGETIGAGAHLPNMATEEFLSCLARPALEAIATEQGLNLAERVKHTRERVVKHYQDGRYLHPDALFAVPGELLESELQASHRYAGSGWDGDDSADDDGAADAESNLAEVDA